MEETCKDPLLFGGGLSNLYEYVIDDPINDFDLAGLQSAENFKDFFGGMVGSLTTVPFTNYSALDLFGKYGKYNPCSTYGKAGSWYGTAIGLAAAWKGIWKSAKSFLSKKGWQIFFKGGKAWHLGLETEENMNIIHIGRHPKYGIHLAIGAIKPFVAKVHYYLQKTFPFIRRWP